MRLILAIAMMLALAGEVGSQSREGGMTPTETLIGGEMEYGWFFAPMAKLTEVSGDIAGPTFSAALRFGKF